MEESVHMLRITSRDFLLRNRQQLREQQNDVQRPLPNLIISHTDVQEIANKLKTKSSLSLEELNILKNSLIDDENNIGLVLSIHGALRGLVRELIGQDVRNQCAAAACICNLSLGDSRTCAKVAKTAGPYLIAALDNLTVELPVTCAWTLGNVAGAGHKACDILTGQGAVSKLIDTLQRPNEEVRDAVVYALVHFTFQLKNELRSEYLIKILNVAPSLEVNETSLRLLFLLSCHKNFIIFELSEIFLQKLLDKLKYYMNSYSTNPELGNSVIYLFRFLGNINLKVVYMLILQYFVLYDMVGSFKEMLIVAKVKESLLWMLGNMYALCGEHEFFRRLLTM